MSAPLGEHELLEAWRAVANAKLVEYRRQVWRLSMLVKQGDLDKGRSRGSAVGDRHCACPGACPW